MGEIHLRSKRAAGTEGSGHQGLAGGMLPIELAAMRDTATTAKLQGWSKPAFDFCGLSWQYANDALGLNKFEESGTLAHQRRCLFSGFMEGLLK